MLFIKGNILNNETDKFATPSYEKKFPHNLFPVYSWLTHTFMRWKKKHLYWPFSIFRRKLCRKLLRWRFVLLAISFTSISRSYILIFWLIFVIENTITINWKTLNSRWIIVVVAVKSMLVFSIMIIIGIINPKICIIYAINFDWTMLFWFQPIIFG